MADNEDEDLAIRTFEDVCAENSAYFAAEMAKATDPKEEWVALRAIFEHPDLVQLFSHPGGAGADKLEQCRAKYALVSASADVGQQVATIVDSLEAPHLRASGILERVQKGLPPASWGLSTLMAKLESHPAPPA